jgi:trehalose 6-phosphate phosphatase
VTAAATLAEQLAPLRADPGSSAVLLDVDGTLAPIVRHADDASVPEATRSVLIAVARRYALVGCVTGRRAADARRIVSLGTIAYVGNHGGELLRPGATEPELDANLMRYAVVIRDFARAVDSRELTKLRVRIEDKVAIAAFHWRAAPDEAAAHAAVEQVAAQAAAAGLETHWGRKVLEVRPPVSVNKGAGIRALLAPEPVRHALYAGDDLTDLDAFRALAAMRDEGRLDTVVRVGVRSDEGPREIEEEADVVVEGTSGARRVLDGLLDE